MTELLQADFNGIDRAATLLRDGALVAFGTETVYGLGADATDDRAVAAIFAAKDRPRFNPLICHYASAEAAFADVVANNDAHRLAAAFWPGPLTLVLPRTAGCRVSLLASAGLDTIAVRVPAHNVALALLRECARPIAAPSANRSGKVSPTTAWHVMAELTGRIAAVLDCGPCGVGVEVHRGGSIECADAVATWWCNRGSDRGCYRAATSHRSHGISGYAAISGNARFALRAAVANAARCPQRAA